MSLTIFLAICILGCDVLIYFFYEWAFGESERIRKRQAQKAQKRSTAARVVEIRRERDDQGFLSRPNPQQEAMAYRRLVASFMQLKPRN
jgi:hypothetical protein